MSNHVFCLGDQLSSRSHRTINASRRGAKQRGRTKTDQSLVSAPQADQRYSRSICTRTYLHRVQKRAGASTGANNRSAQSCTADSSRVSDARDFAAAESKAARFAASAEPQTIFAAAGAEPAAAQPHTSAQSGTPAKSSHAAQPSYATEPGNAAKSGDATEPPDATESRNATQSGDAAQSSYATQSGHAAESCGPQPILSSGTLQEELGDRTKICWDHQKP